MKKIISNNMNALKALAIILVVIYHLPVHTGVYVLDSIKGVLYCGVDVFILLMGFGLYHSLEKNDVGTYAIRRVKSIVPYYLPFILVFVMVRKVTYQLYLTELVGNLTMTGWLAGNPGQFNWYVDALLVLYVLAPVIYGVIKKSKNIYVCGIILIGLAFVISVNFWHTDYLILATRLPIFILGFLLADDRLSDVIDSKWFLILVNIISAMGIAAIIFLFGNNAIDRWHYGTWWYPFFMIIPGLSIDILLGLNAIRNKLSVKYLDEFGKMTFSIYLWHIFVFEFLQGRAELGALTWILVALGVIVFSCIYHLVIKKIVSVIVK